MSSTTRNSATLIFDFDGTIADTFSFYLSILDKLSKKFGFQRVHQHQAETLRDLDFRKTVDLLQIPKIKLPFIVWEARRMLKPGLTHINPFAEIKETIEEIRKKEILLGILTTNSVKNVKTFLRAHKFPEFDFIFSSIQIWNKAKALKRVLHHRKLQPHTVFYVGDETRDIEAAKEAGIRSIAVTWGYNSPKILQSFSPDYLVSEPRDIIGIVMNSIKN